MKSYFFKSADQLDKNEEDKVSKILLVYFLLFIFLLLTIGLLATGEVIAKKLLIVFSVEIFLLLPTYYMYKFFNNKYILIGYIFIASLVLSYYGWSYLHLKNSVIILTFINLLAASSFFGRRLWSIKKDSIN